ncbi:protein phosphatase 1 regulatory subunit 12B-like isoform X2 [Pseudoliparis swirei]|uniref:protein phosphatase 1 regulatory subunit 12B-like isoform X2 n=1 Tax=Pseudoliparis swirei TaxID=2059687 RepID=UPI0024BDC8D1|nr:protein phosphatase 1 regulatory subunit 12B-like isoform X2 [Pseudoliparis swirei]
MRSPAALGAMSSLLSHNKDQPRIRKSLSDSSPTSSTAATKSQRHERLSRLSSSGSSDVSNDTSTNHAESYFLRRENRLSARKRAEEEAANNDYKKMYEKALATNQRLKSRLETSKQELAMIQDQLQRAQESRCLQKKISDMEEQIKVKGELKVENQRLKDENGALIRVITKLSK